MNKEQEKILNSLKREYALLNKEALMATTGLPEETVAAACAAASSAWTLARCLSSMNTPAHTPSVARNAQRKRRMLRFISKKGGGESEELCGVDRNGARGQIGARGG